jgi:6-phosphogluconolactonase
MRTIRVENPHEAGIIAASLIAEIARGSVFISLPGGRSVVPVYDELSRYPRSVLSNLRIRIGDERIFGEKNEQVIEERLIAPARARGIMFDFKAPSGPSREEIIASYKDTIDTDVFDLVLLGVGEDGHVLGLYPGFPQLDSSERVEAFDDSPKPPPERMTTTFNCYDAHRTRAILLFLGEGKREALTRFLAEPDHHTLPAARFASFKDAFVITDLL